MMKYYRRIADGSSVFKSAPLVLMIAILVFCTKVYDCDAQSLPEPGTFVLDAVEQKMPTGDASVKRDIFPDLSGGIALSPDMETFEKEYHYQLVEAPDDKRAEVESRLESLKKSELYGMTKFEYFGESKTKPVYLTKAYFTRSLAIEGSHCGCIKKFPFQVFGCPADTPLSYGCLFEFIKNRDLILTWPEDEEQRFGESGEIKAPIYWGHDLCDENIKEIFVECSIDLSPNGVPIQRINYSAQPIAVRTDEKLYLVKEAGGGFHEDIKDCGMVTRSTINGFHAFEMKRNDDDEFMMKISADLLKRLIERFGAPPLNAEPEVTLSDEVIMTSKGNKSDLLDGKYELSGYVIRVYSEKSSLKINIRYNILTAKHPDSAFTHPSGKELERYSKAIGEKVRAARDHMLIEYGGRIQGDVGVIGD